MIRHVVLFSVPPGGDVEAILEGLSVLATIPHARRIEIGRNVKSDLYDTGVDVVVYGEFDDAAALAAYRAHPAYAESVRRVRPLREMRMAADLDTRTLKVAGPVSLGDPTPAQEASERS
jgi:hypothetical protein